MLRTLKEAWHALLVGLGVVSCSHPSALKNKWIGLDRGPCYWIEDLGRPAVFYLPADKLRLRLPQAEVNGDTVERIIQDFLLNRFGGFNRSLLGQFGVWSDGKKSVHYDECVMYEVSFVGKERIPMLVSFLSVIAGQIEEKCIYFKAGQYSGLVWPTDE